MNGTEIEYTKTDNGNEATFSFDVTISQNTEVVIWFSNDQNWKEGSYGVTYTGASNAVSLLSESENDILKESVTLTVGNNWSHTFTGLPLSVTDADGNTVTYTYYVEEVPVSGYDTTYENNAGITSGTITVKNRKNTTETPSYELPETGSGGTFLYTMGGAALVALSLLLATCPRRRGERRVRH
ncbi:MAG: Cna B-type domain-containing protein [Butyricicoccus sp.]